MSEIKDLIAACHATRAGVRATAEEKADARTLTPSQQRARADAIRPTSEPEVRPGVEAETDGHQESL